MYQVTWWITSTKKDTTKGLTLSEAYKLYKDLVSNNFLQVVITDENGMVIAIYGILNRE